MHGILPFSTFLEEDKTAQFNSVQFQDNDTTSLQIEQSGILSQKNDLSDLVLNGLIPKDYQRELFFRSLKENSIIVLDTGAGKTLIAAMLLEHYGLSECFKKNTTKTFESNALVLYKNIVIQNKLSFFLCNTFALVHQQGNFLQKSTSRLVKIHKSGAKTSNITKNQWCSYFNSAEVHVMTPQILLDCLRRGFISMENIKLIIFDECHHSIKNSPYNRIVREFYNLLSSDKKPRLIGLTASVVNPSDNIQKSIIELQQNLDSTIHTISDQKNLITSENKIKYVVLEYNIENNYSKNWFRNIFTTLATKHEELTNYRAQMDFIVSELGFFAGTVVLTSIYLELKNNLYNFFLKSDGSGSHANTICSVEQKNNMGSSFLLKKFFQNQIDKNDIIKIQDTMIFLEVKTQLSPKVNALLEYLISFKNLHLNMDSQANKQLKVIIFVNRQSTAYTLSLILKALIEFDFLKSEPFVGSRKGSKNNIVKMLNNNYFKNKKDTTINNVLQRFRLGKTNVLIATQIAEEGIDIAMCNMVIRFDPALTLTSFIQARGRARDKESIYAIMVPKNSKRSLDHRNENEKNSKTPKLQGKKFDKNSHRELTHYESLIEMEQYVKNIDNMGNSADITHTGNEIINKLAAGKLSKTISNNPEELNVNPKIIDHMKIDSSITIDHKSKQILDHIATELSAYTMDHKIDEIYFKIEDSGAQLTIHSAISFLNNYGNFLGSETDNPCKIDYKFGFKKNKGFFYKITFSSFSLVKSITGPYSQNKKLSKKAAAFFSCISLYYYGALNSYLIPISSKSSLAEKNFKVKTTEIAYEEINAILGTLNCTNIYDPFIQKAEENSHRNDECTSININNFIHKSNSKTSNDSIARAETDLIDKNENINIKKRKYDECFTEQNNIKKKKVYKQQKSISFQLFNPKNWIPPKMIYNESNLKSANMQSGYIQAYAYICNLDHDTAFTESYNLHTNNDITETGFHLLAFFTKPLPKNLIIPLYLNDNSTVPTFYLFDPIPVLLDPNMHNIDQSFDRCINTQNSNYSKNNLTNKIYLPVNKWNDLVSFTSSLFSLIMQNEYRLDPKLSSYVFAVPTKKYNLKINEVYKKRNTGKIELLTLDPDITNLALENFFRFSEYMPVFSLSDIDWKFILDFLMTPIRLSSIQYSEWFDILSKHFIVSDSNKFCIYEYLQTIEGTNANNTFSEIFSGIAKISNFLTENESKNKTTIKHNQTDLVSSSVLEIKNSEILKNKYNHILLHLQEINFEKCIEDIPTKAKEIRFIDYLFQNSMINHDLSFKNLTEDELFLIKEVNYKTNYLCNSSKFHSLYIKDNKNSITDANDTYNDLKKNKYKPESNQKSNLNQDTTSTDIQYDDLNFISLKMIREYNEIAKNRENNVINDKVDDYKNVADQQHSITPEVSEKLLKDQEKIECRAFLDIIAITKSFFAVPTLIRIIPWVKKDFLKLTILPALMQRLHTTLIQNDLYEAIKLPMDIGSTSFSHTDKNTLLELLENSLKKSTMSFYLHKNLESNKAFSDSNNQMSKTLLYNSDLYKSESISSNKYLENITNYYSEEVDLKLQLRIKNYSKYNNSSGWLVRSSLTHESTEEDVNYQRLEILGDAVLKLLISTQLFAGLAPLSSGEGVLSHYGGLLVSNNFLSKISKKIGLFYGGHYIKFEKKDWAPPGLGWKRSNYPLPRTIPYNSQPWNFFRGCPGIISDTSDFSDRFDFTKCNCILEPLEITNKNNSDLKTIGHLTNREPIMLEKLTESVTTNINLDHSLENKDLLSCSLEFKGNLQLIEALPSEITKNTECVEISLDELRYYSNINKVRIDDTDFLQNKTEKALDNSTIMKSCDKNPETFINFFNDQMKKTEHIDHIHEMHETAINVCQEKNKMEKSFKKENLNDLSNENSSIKEISKDNIEFDSKKFKCEVKLPNTQIKLDYKDEFIPPRPIYCFFPTKKPKERTKPKAPFHKQHYKQLIDKIKYADVLPKTQADFVESILGAAYKFGNIKTAFSAAKAMGIVKKNWDYWEDMFTDFQELYQSQVLAEGSIYNMLNQNYIDNINIQSNKNVYTEYNTFTLSCIENILGYQFKTPEICFEAITHKSATNTSIYSYERLEYLGDSIISFITTNYLYDQINTAAPLSTHIITLLKHIAVSNDVLGLIAHLHNLTDFLMYDQKLFDCEIKIYRNTINSVVNSWMKKSKETHNSENINENTTSANYNLSLANLYEKDNDQTILKCSDLNEKENIKSDLNQWLDIPSELWKYANPPKIMGDLLESLLGAVYTDSGFSLDIVTQVAKRIYLPFIKKFIDPHFVSLNPIVQFGLMIQSTRCSSYKYLISDTNYALNSPKFKDLINKNRKTYGDSINIARDMKLFNSNALNDYKSNQLNNNDKGVYICLITAHDSSILGFGYGNNSKRAKTKAAEFAVQNWDKGQGISSSELLKKSCDCLNKRDFDSTSAYSCLMKEVSVPGLDKKISGLLFADDAVILAESADELQKSFDTLTEWCKRWDMNVNNKKCGIMAIN
ncbi:hypothetical protein BB561_003112 [Smittium simulii]|uniref:Dicer-like protein 1 n=1 Tax=Smittium simulii TaxID=133385 RepID=A0A2T9YMW1_9FUNG|nr:hypothetical protein BB561_003112 [Smittium simulii]